MDESQRQKVDEYLAGLAEADIRTSAPELNSMARLLQDNIPSIKSYFRALALLSMAEQRLVASMPPTLPLTLSGLEAIVRPRIDKLIRSLSREEDPKQTELHAAAERRERVMPDRPMRRRTH